MNITRKPPAIILGSYINALALIRALGKKGIDIIVVDCMHNIAASSKYVKEFVLSPDPENDHNGYINVFLERSNQWKGGIIIPTDDFQVSVLSVEYDKLSKYYEVAAPVKNTAEIIINKILTYSTASELNIPCPFLFLLNNEAQLTNVANSIEYPCILKPVISHEFKKHHNYNIKKIASNHELYRAFEENGGKYPLMVQEIIKGPDSNIVLYAAYYDMDGNYLAEFTGQKIRQYPPGFGTARVAKSIEFHDELACYSRKILKRVAYRGCLVGTEFKYDDKDGKLKLVEINARSVKWYSLIEASGMNLPWIMYKDRIFQEKSYQQDYISDVYWIDEAADIATTIFNRKKENIAYRDYLKPYYSKKVLAVFSKNDIKPSISMINFIANYIKNKVLGVTKKMLWSNKTDTSRRLR